MLGNKCLDRVDDNSWIPRTGSAQISRLGDRQIEENVCIAKCVYTNYVEVGVLFGMLREAMLFLSK